MDKRFNNFMVRLFIEDGETGKNYIDEEARYLSKFLGGCFVFDETDVKNIDRLGDYEFAEPVSELFAQVANELKETGSDLSVFYTDKMMIINIPRYQAEYFVEEMGYSMFNMEYWSNDRSYGRQTKLHALKSPIHNYWICFENKSDLDSYMEVYNQFYRNSPDCDATIKVIEINPDDEKNMAIFDGYALM